MHSSLKINLEGAAVTGASNGAGRGPSYVAFKIPFASLEVAWGTGGHINVDATLRTLLGPLGAEWINLCGGNAMNSKPFGIPNLSV